MSSYLSLIFGGTSETPLSGFSQVRSECRTPKEIEATEEVEGRRSGGTVGSAMQLHFNHFMTHIVALTCTIGHSFWQPFPLKIICSSVFSLGLTFVWNAATSLFWLLNPSAGPLAGCFLRLGRLLACTFPAVQLNPMPWRKRREELQTDHRPLKEEGVKQLRVKTAMWRILGGEGKGVACKVCTDTAPANPGVAQDVICFMLRQPLQGMVNHAGMIHCSEALVDRPESRASC